MSLNGCIKMYRVHRETIGVPVTCVTLHEGVSFSDWECHMQEGCIAIGLTFPLWAGNVIVWLREGDSSQLFYQDSLESSSDKERMCDLCTVYMEH